MADTPVPCAACKTLPVWIGAQVKCNTQNCRIAGWGAMLVAQWNTTMQEVNYQAPPKIDE